MQFKRAIRCVAFALTVALGWSLWAACADAAISSSAMACCKDGEMTCAPHGSASDCCATDAARPRDAVATARTNPVHSFAAVVAWAAIPSLATADDTYLRASQLAAPSRLEFGPPPYIAFSSLLI